MKSLPPNWKVDRSYINGNGKLVAQYVNKHKNLSVHVIPHKSYDIGGLPNCHKVKVIKWRSKDLETIKRCKTIEKGLSLEHNSEARDRALKTVKRLDNGEEVF